MGHQDFAAVLVHRSQDGVHEASDSPTPSSGLRATGGLGLGPSEPNEVVMASSVSREFDNRNGIARFGATPKLE